LLRATKSQLDSVVRNVQLIIEFDGTAYAGWQSQPNHLTIQGLLERAAQRLFGQRIKIYGCSRTDAGVSARNYVANFSYSSSLPVEKIPAALNFYLPADIYVKSADIVPEDFHARYSARLKTYTYRIVYGRSPLRSRRSWEVGTRLDVQRLKSVAKLFIGTLDFQPFCHCQSGPSICTVKSITCKQFRDEILITVKGDRFLYKMVRRIVGALVAYSSCRLTKRDIRRALKGRKHKPFVIAPARGLILEGVQY